jgi:hypothetical protein
LGFDGLALAGAALAGSFHQRAAAVDKSDKNDKGNE